VSGGGGGGGKAAAAAAGRGGGGMRRWRRCAIGVWPMGASCGWQGARGSRKDPTHPSGMIECVTRAPRAERASARARKRARRAAALRHSRRLPIGACCFRLGGPQRTYEYSQVGSNTWISKRGLHCGEKRASGGGGEGRILCLSRRSLPLSSPSPLLLLFGASTHSRTPTINHLTQSKQGLQLASTTRPRPPTDTTQANARPPARRKNNSKTRARSSLPATTPPPSPSTAGAVRQAKKRQPPSLPFRPPRQPTKPLPPAPHRS